ncbi:MAG TPA: ADOP family duplicated permease [Opitutaceae bacterium]|nr:ADOP family duplicated permease [Opitutaceae bacterium]
MWSDLTLAFRSLARSPGFTAAVVGTLALGMGAAAALHSNLAQSFRPYRFPDMERLVRVEAVSRDNAYPQQTFLARYLAYRERAKAFASLAGGVNDTLNLVVNGEPDGLNVSRVTANYFTILGEAPLLGRTFLPGEDEVGRDAVAVLTHRLWRDRFGSDPNVVGQKILLNERSYEVIGVLREEFRLPPMTPSGRLFIPYVMPTAAIPQNAFHGVATVARLREGVTREQAEAELRTILPEAGQPYAEGMGRFQAVVPRFDAMPEYPGLQRQRATQWISVGAVSFLYLIACVNAGSLLLVRAVARKREVGIRLALGAGRWAVSRPLFAEALVISAVAVGFGIVVAKWLMPALMAIAPGVAEDHAYRAINLSWGTLGFLAGLGFLTGLAVASGPAWRTAQLNVNEAIKDSSQGGGESRRMRRVRALLVVVEATLAVALLAGTGLMIRTLHQLQNYHPGLETENGFNLVLRLSREERLSTDQRLERFKQVVERLRQVPGVTGVSMSSYFSPTNYSGQKYKIAGRPQEEVEANGTPMAPDFLEVIGVPLRSGRSLAELRQGDPASVVVSESFARTYFPGRNPVGELLELDARTRWEIIGVVGDVRSARQTPKPRFYYPYWQRGSGAISAVVVRTAGPPRPGFHGELKRAVYEVEPKFAVASIQRLDQQLIWEVGGERFTMVVLEVLAALALLLALLGLFAMMAYSVNQRQAEFGVRLTFGATPDSIRALVVGGGLKLAGVGVAAGLLLAWTLSRFMQAVLYDTKGWDPLVFGTVAALMFLAALPACWLPARAAGKLDVARLLRPE